MTSDNVAELFALIGRALEISRQQAEEIKTIRAAQAQMEGQITVMTQWMQAMERRYTALLPGLEVPQPPAD